MIAHTRLAGGVVAVSAAVIMTITGCGKDSAPPAASKSATSSSAATSTTASAPAQPVDYSALLIKATDLVAPEEFIASPPVPDPDGKPGIATSFGNADRTHVVGDTILILPDPPRPPRHSNRQGCTRWQRGRRHARTDRGW